MKIRRVAVACTVLLTATLPSCTSLNGGPDMSGESPRPVTGQLCDPPDPVCAEVVTFGQNVLETVGATGIDSRVERSADSTTYETTFVVRHFSAVNIAQDYRFTFEVRDREGNVSWKPIGTTLEDRDRVLRFRGRSELAIHDVTVRLTTLKKETVRVRAVITGRQRPRTA